MSHILHPPSDLAGHDSRRAPVTLDLFRWHHADQAGPSMQRYVIPYRRRMSVFTALREIYEHQDRTVAFRNQQCGRGICGTCRVRVELARLSFTDKGIKACAIPLEPGDHIVVRPAYESRVIRDVVVDF